MHENKAERRNITQPAAWWAEFEKAARRSGQTLSEWLGECGVANLPADVQAKLPERQGAGRPTGES